MIGKHLKDYKKAYKADRRENRRTCVKRNSDWKKRWLPFIKYDHDFDGFFLIELMVHKLHIMLDYYDHGKYCMQVDESRLEIVESLKEACRLGDLILEDDFNEPAYKVMMEHHRMWTEPCKDNSHLCEIKMEWDSPEAKAEYDRLEKETDALREKTIDEFFDFVRKHYREWWD
jgi:hypothetical protein